MRFSVWTFVPFTAALALAFPRVAAADDAPNRSIAIDTAGIVFAPSDPNRRPQNLNPTGINHQDCVDDIEIDIPLTLSGLDSSETLYVWAGTADCTEVAARGASPTCWYAVPGGVFDAQGKENVVVRLHAQDIVSQLGATTIVPSAPSGPAACNLAGNVTTTAKLLVSIYFIYASSVTGVSSITPQAYQIPVKLLGPRPPAGVSAASEDGALSIAWTPSADTDGVGYTVYCDPPPGGPADAAASTEPPELVCEVPVDDVASPSDAGASDAGASDAGASDAGARAGDSGADAGSGPAFMAVSMGPCPEGGAAPAGCTCVTPPVGGFGGTCSSALLLGDGGATVDAGATGPRADSLPSQAVCGQASSMGSGGVTTSANLVNGATYAVAVAATDAFGNVGALSQPLACGTPRPVDDFFKVYRAAGGMGGGGFCTLERSAAPAGTTAFALAGAWGVLALVRRRAKRRAR